MADIVGSIAPAADIREAPAFTEPCRTIEISDPAGRLHGRIEWIASEVDEDFSRALLELYATAVKSTGLARVTAPASAS